MKNTLRIAILVIIMIFTLVLSGCQNTAARSFGGTTTIQLEPNQKLVSCSWKDDEFWYLTRPMRTEETAETYKYQEQSNLGIFEGTVVVIETKD